MIGLYNNIRTRYQIIYFDSKTTLFDH